MRGLLIGHDQQVADWAFKFHNVRPFHVDRAIGVIDDDRLLIGAALIHFSNGMDAHLSFYGQGALSLGICRALARVAVYDLKLARATLIIRRRPRRLLPVLLRMGYKIEGAQRCYYGHKDCHKNTGLRLVMFRDQLERIANVQEPQEIACST